MMRHNLETTRTARICQAASLLAILSMVLAVLAHDVRRGPGGTAERQPTRLVVAP
jgi:hypothetical protein